MPTKSDVTLEGWPKGLNNVAKDTALPEGSLRDALNVDLDDSGKPSRRVGRTKLVSGTNTHSLYAAACGPVYCEGATLTQLLPDYTTRVLGDLTRSDRVSYDTVDDLTYLTNGYDIWTLTKNGDFSTHGVPTPDGQPLVAFSSSIGSLRPARYLISMTYIGSDGEESGASLSTEVTTSETGSLTLSAIPQDPAATHIRIYMTEPDGEILREHAQIPAGTLSYILTQSVMGRALETQFMRRLPAGNMIRYYNGRLYVVDDTVVWHSEALRYGLYSPADNFFEFREPITVFEPVFNGIYVVADRTYFLSGDEPKSMKLIEVSEDVGIYGTGMTVDAADFDPQLTGEAAYWYGDEGATLGLPGGIINKLMDDAVALPGYDEGASIMREHNGVRQAVTAVRGSGASAAFSLGDEISVTVRRNGILL